MAEIASSYRVAKVKRGDPNEQVREGNGTSGEFCVRINFRRDLGHISCKRLHRNSTENRIQIVPPLPGDARAIRAINPCSNSIAVMEESTI